MFPIPVRLRIDRSIHNGVNYISVCLLAREPQPLLVVIVFDSGIVAISQTRTTRNYHVYLHSQRCTRTEKLSIIVHHHLGWYSEGTSILLDQTVQ